MSDKAKSIIAAGWIAAAAGAFIFGSLVRDRVDLASPTRGAKLDNLVASRDNMMGDRMQTDIPAGDFFYELTEKLKKEFYEPIGDEQKLASGAVRGMIGYLGDPESTFMDKKQFQTYLNERQGKFEGIGADLEVLMISPGAKASTTVAAITHHAKGTGIGSELAGHAPGGVAPNAHPPQVAGGQRQLLQPSPSEDPEEERDRALAPASNGEKLSAFPRLAVVSIVPGGPADRAGVKVGDLVYSIDDHWVINADLGTRFNKAENDFRLHKISWPELNAIRKEVRDKYERMILPLRAKDRLDMGASGAVKIVWDRGPAQRTTTMERANCSMPGFQANGDRINLPFTQDSPDLLRKAIAGKSEVTIDLRNNTLGDFGVMRECIAALAPAGVYGYESNERTSKAVALRVSEGNSHPPKITLLTDRSTRGSAEIFALALSSRGCAKLSGDDSGGAREVYDVVRLPDGSGYTLVTARYHPMLDIKPGRVATTGAHKK